jgi:hypothetical protein
MKVIGEGGYVAGVELTRRNLETLLAKLDGTPPNSACTIAQGGFYVKAVENEVHYANRKPGPIYGES